MKREQLDKLTVEKQLEIFNKIIKEQGSLNKAIKVTGMPKSTIKGRLEKIGYKYSEEAKQFVKDINTQPKSETSLIEPIISNKEQSNSNIIEPSDKSSSKIVESKENNNLVDISQLDNIIDEKLEKLLDKYLKNNSDPKNNDTSIKIDTECDGNVKYSTYGVYENIAIKFNEYVEKHKKRFSKIELTTQALLEYMQNHK